MRNLNDSISKSIQKLETYDKVNAIAQNQMRTRQTNQYQFAVLESINPELTPNIDKALYTTELSGAWFQPTHAAYAACLEHFTRDMLSECRSEIIELVNYYAVTLTNDRIMSDSDYIDKTKTLAVIDVPTGADLDSLNWSVVINATEMLVKVTFKDADGKDIERQYIPSKAKDTLTELVISNYEYQSTNVDELCRFIAMFNNNDDDISYITFINALKAMILFKRENITHKSTIIDESITSSNRKCILNGVIHFVRILTQLYGSYESYTELDNKLTQVINTFEDSDAIISLKTPRGESLEFNCLMTYLITTPWLDDFKDVMGMIVGVLGSYKDKIGSEDCKIDIKDVNDFKTDFYQEYIQLRKAIVELPILNTICYCVEMFMVKEES